VAIPSARPVPASPSSAVGPTCTRGRPRSSSSSRFSTRGEEQPGSASMTGVRPSRCRTLS
jgi:hypothetical protein